MVNIQHMIYRPLSSYIDLDNSLHTLALGGGLAQMVERSLSM